MQNHLNRRRRGAGGSLLVVAGLLLALFAILPVAAQGQTAVVHSEPAVLEISPGQTVTLTVVLADAQDVYGIDVRAAFDPQLVEVVDADPAKDGIQFTPGTFPQPDFVARNIADNVAGTLRYAVTQVNPTQPVSGAGVVFVVEFRGKTPGEAALKLGPVEMANRQGQALPVTTRNGTVRVSTTTTLPAPAHPVLATEPALSPTPMATSAPLATSETPGPLPCSSALLPVLGLFGLAGWRIRHHGQG